ncbi:MAG: peptidoglycan DD-metalloendopeptidase family protein [Novosphingobium sp.]|nr:peptidoglycan DD-metalloendopeptidase family protein [Novosphingobium sp.]
MKAATRLVIACMIVAGTVGGGLLAQSSLSPGLRSSSDPEIARRELSRAIRDGKRAKYRAERLEEDARRATQRAERTAAQAASVAARIQETEARISAREAQVRLMATRRVQLQARLAKQQVPLIRLSAALQRLSRRPPAIGLLRPGSVRDTVYLRAMLATVLPQVEAKTASVRKEISRIRKLTQEEKGAAEALSREQVRLRERQGRLAAIETEQRLDLRRVSGIASRENERALALAERAKDLEDLVEVVDRQGKLRRELAALPGPLMRPPRPLESRVVGEGASASAPRGLTAYILPVAGRLVTGFGEASASGRPSRGIVLAARGGAQVVAPAEGTVAFAGPYRGYDRIVIVEHEGGWTSLVTGLARLDAQAGEKLVAGSPLGVVSLGEGLVRLELRKSGEPVNPLRYMGGA